MKMNQQSNTKKLMPIVMAATLFFLTLSVASAAPTVELNPAEPEPQGTVTFTATIPDVENIEKVTIRVQECGNEPDIGYICYTDEFNETMTESTENTYTASITLTHKNAIDLKYQLNYLTNQGWTIYPDDDLITVDLDTSGQTNGDNNGDNGDSGSDTPGFELIGLALSVIFISLIMYRRKR
jgi:hypothetical protein